MHLKSCCLAGVALCLSLLSVPVQAIRLDRGTWDMHFEAYSDVAGRHAERHESLCSTDRDYDPTRAFILRDCHISDVREDSGSVTWRVDCDAGRAGLPAMQGNGRFSVEGATADGEIVLKTAPDAAGNPVERRWNGRRVAPLCE